MLKKKNFTRQLLTNWNVWIAFCCGTFAKTHSRVSRRRIFFLSSYSPEIWIETRRGWKMFVRRGRWRVKFSFSRVSPQESARVPERSSRVGSRLISASVNSEWVPRAVAKLRGACTTCSNLIYRSEIGRGDPTPAGSIPFLRRTPAGT